MRDTVEPGLPSGAGVPASESPRPQGMVLLMVAVVVVAALYLAKAVLIPITLAILLSFVLGPVVALLRGLRLPKVLAVLLAVIFALLVILLLGALIGTQIADLAQNFALYQITMMHKFESVRSLVNHEMASLSARFGNFLTPDHHATTNPGGGVSHATNAVAPPMPVTVETPEPSAFGLARSLLTPILQPLETVGIVIVFAIFFLLQKEDLRDRLIRLFGSSDLHRTTLAIDDAGSRLSLYFLAQTGINAGFGVVICVGLAFIGLPNPILWGVLAMLLRFVPYIGSPISALLPIALAAAVDPHWGLAIATLVLFLVAEGITGQVIEPMTYGSTTGLSPVAVLVVAVFWGWLWGPIGLILSTPITLCLVVVGRHVKQLEFFDVLLGDRPALTPVETFYQRLLAHDPDEVQEQAEQLLQTRSLSAYYDSVARPGLKLAEGDIARAAMSEVQVRRLRHDIAALIEELDAWDDADPPHRLRKAEVEVAGVERPGRGDSAEPAPEIALAASAEPPLVLCIAGRGLLDDLPNAMLAQLLRKHGFRTRVVPFDAASRSRLAELDVAGVDLVCVTALEVAGQPPHLRYLVRRLRQRLPDAPILIGLRTAPDAETLRDASVLGADTEAASLRDLVIAAVQRVRLPPMPVSPPPLGADGERAEQDPAEHGEEAAERRYQRQLDAEERDEIDGAAEQEDAEGEGRPRERDPAAG
ncbi:AI-2E family transporter [Acidisoma sp. C75]